MHLINKQLNSITRWCFLQFDSQVLQWMIVFRARVCVMDTDHHHPTAAETVTKWSHQSPERNLFEIRSWTWTRESPMSSFFFFFFCIFNILFFFVLDPTDLREPLAIRFGSRPVFHVIKKNKNLTNCGCG